MCTTKSLKVRLVYIFIKYIQMASSIPIPGREAIYSIGERYKWSPVFLKKDKNFIRENSKEKFTILIENK